MKDYITGIQQAGIGVEDAEEAKYLYKELFGMNVLVFEDKAPASLMTRYTGKVEHNRHALLCLNMSGGGGFELWQFTSRVAQKPLSATLPGDLGIFAIKIKCRNIRRAHAHFSEKNNLVISAVTTTPDKRPHFWITDQNGNHFEIVEGDEWFKKDKNICGGVVGAVIGVSNMDKALHFYNELLGVQESIYNETERSKDFPNSNQQGEMFNRVLLKKHLACKGAFSKLLGAVQIELIETKEREPKKIYDNRFWGDCGFIHLCFDVVNMDQMKNRFTKAGYTFSVDSQDSFSMGSSAGRFCYVEDPDGTLIELVETHKIPIFKKLGWYINLQKRNPDKPLPNWMVGLLGLNKIR